jgi:hypothetical protein
MRWLMFLELDSWSAADTGRDSIDLPELHGQLPVRLLLPGFGLAGDLPLPQCFEYDHNR